MQNVLLAIFQTLGSQAQGVSHCHAIVFYPQGGYDPCADMWICYDPHLSYLKYAMKRQGLSPGAVYQSAVESTLTVTIVFN